ncbi:MAG: YcjF family protein [Halocynthiibacter sp.]
MSDRKAPILLDIDDEADITPETAPEIIDTPPATGEVMQKVIRRGARKKSGIARLFWWSFAAVGGLLISVALYETSLNFVARYPMLGKVLLALFVVLALTALVFVVKELVALMRLRSLDVFRKRAVHVRHSGQTDDARDFVTALGKLYKSREGAKWGIERAKTQSADMVDAGPILDMTEREVLAPLDAEAVLEIENAARQVALATAIVPLAFADVAVAFAANMRMIRQIAEIYGGRGGVIGNWRLVRAVFAHLLATGMVAIGDDFIGSIAGGSVIGKISRRFGEGMINGALTARVGVATMEICRPMEFHAKKRPSVTGIVKRSVTGLWA